MTLDRELADRLRNLLDAEPGLAERRMFGGLAFLVGGNMAVAASGQGGLLVRVDPADDSLLSEPGVQPMEMRGRVVDGWLRVEADALMLEGALERWAERGVAYARSLPSK